VRSRPDEHVFDFTMDKPDGPTVNRAMARARWLRAAGMALAALCGCKAPSPAAERDGPREIRVGAVRAFIASSGKPQAPETIAGDAVLQGAQFGVQVEGRGRAERRGAIAALFDLAGAHDWEAMHAMLAWQGTLHEVKLERVELARLPARQGPDRPTIIVHGAVETPDLRLRVRRVLQLTDVASGLRIGTRVAVERGSVPRDLVIVERVAWGGGSPVAPLAGPLQHESPVDAEWVGRSIDGRAVVLGSPSGPAHVVGLQADHGRADVLRHTDVFLPTSAKDGQFHAVALLSASRAGLGDAVRRLGWMRGKPFTEARVALTASPPGAEVQVRGAQSGLFVSSARPDANGRAVLPIPDAALRSRLTVVAVARGREASPRGPLPGPPYPLVTLTIPAGSRLEVAAEHAATLEPIPVRIRVLPQRATRAPDLGPDWAASGALDTVIAPAGRASIPLPTGYYRVLVTHGPEWSVHDQQVELGVGETTRVRARLEHVVDPGPWVACELHVHAAPSPDSEVALADRVASLAAEGIAFAVPTDHNHVGDYDHAIGVQPLQGLASVPGVEVTTSEPALGHFNAFPFPIDPELPGNGAPDPTGVEPGELFAALHALDPDLVVQVNHPRLEGGIGYFDATGYEPRSGEGGALYSDDYDTLEVWNGFDLGRREQVDRVWNEWLAMLARGRRIVATGSSDSHTIRSEMAGYPRTYVRAPLAGVSDPRALVRALRQGRAFVTSGPFLNARIDGKGPGEEVLLGEGAIELEVLVQAPSWMQVHALRVYHGGTLVHRSALGAPTHVRFSGLANRYERTLRLNATQPGALVVAVDGDKELAPIVPRGGVRPFAFTNPIWLVDQLTPVAAPPDAGVPSPPAAGNASPPDAAPPHSHSHSPTLPPTHGHAPPPDASPTHGGTPAP
jgi:hypothetical protein